MLALDQRESMRGMFGRLDDGTFVGDDSLRTFKRQALETLSPFASAVLIDRPYGLGNSRPPELAAGSGLMVAIDVLHQVPGEEISHITFDALVTVDLLRQVGADAIKVLVLWHPRSGKIERAELVGRAMERAAQVGVATLVEGIVRPEPGESWATEAERHDAILACAQELMMFSPDIYKAQVPGYSPGDVSDVAAQSELMSAIVGGDWVVLSSGVERDYFGSAVT
jgi:sulfofructosephosphate aldolase